MESEREDEESTLDPDHLETFTAFGEARRIVTVIGFGASGKTFLVNRLREALSKQMRWRTYPKKQDRIEITPEGLWLTEVNPTRQGRDKPLVLLDCAGESFQRAFDEQSTSASLSGVGVRSYLTALACASAYVFVIQAEHLADAASGNPNDKRKVAELCESFHEIIDGIRLAKAGLANAKGPKDFLARGIPRTEFKNVRKAPGPRLNEPLFVALSQADRLEGHEPLDDPLAFAYQGAASLVAAVEARFATYRFDFVSSFFEHQPADDDPLRVDYGRPHYGVTEMFTWLEERLSRKGRRSLGDKLAGELETRVPLWLRRKVDPSVRLGGKA